MVSVLLLNLGNFCAIQNDVCYLTLITFEHIFPDAKIIKTKQRSFENMTALFIVSWKIMKVTPCLMNINICIFLLSTTDDILRNNVHKSTFVSE